MLFYERRNIIRIINKVLTDLLRALKEEICHIILEAGRIGRLNMYPMSLYESGDSSIEEYESGTELLTSRDTVIDYLDVLNRLHLIENLIELENLLKGILLIHHYRVLV